jgi:hypothetical protein
MPLGVSFRILSLEPAPNPARRNDGQRLQWVMITFVLDWLWCLNSPPPSRPG